jgi:hypothetical protein
MPVNHKPYVFALLGSAFCIPAVVLAHGTDATETSTDGGHRIGGELPIGHIR